MSKNPGDLLQQAIAAARAGQKEEAKQLLVQVLKANPRSEQAWIWMSATVDTPPERIHCLKQVLKINPENQLAIKGLKALGALEEPAPTAPPPPAPEPTGPPPSEPEPEPPSQEAVEPAEAETPIVEEEPLVEAVEPEAEIKDEAEAPPAPELEVEPEPEPAVGTKTRRELPPLPEPPLPKPQPTIPDGVPLIPDEVITQAQREADGTLGEIQRWMELPELGIDWAPAEDLQTTPRRGGIDLRPTPMMLIIGAAVALIVVIVVMTLTFLNRMQEQRRLASITPTVPPTLTATPLPTNTPRPTRTPTPESRGAVNEAMLPAGQAPRGVLERGITPTPYYVATGHPSLPVLNSAIEAYHEGRYEDALASIEQSRSSDDPIDSYYYEAMSLIAQGNYTLAQGAVEAGLDKEEQFAPLHYAQGLIHMHNNASERAQRAFERAVELDPELVEAHISLAEVYTQEGDYASAREQVNIAREVDDYNAGVLATASKVFLATGDVESAAEYANLAAYIDPGAEEVILQQARVRLALGYSEPAAIGLENYIEQINEGSAEAWALLGQAYGQLDRPGDAQFAFARALQLSDEVTSALVGRGLFYVMQDEYELAYEDLGAAIENGVTAANVRFGYAMAAYQLGEYEDGLDVLESLLEENPDDGSMATLYVLTLVEDGQYEETIEAANNVLFSGGLTLETQAVINEAKARALYELERYQEARASLQEAMFVGETGTRRYYDALISVELGELEPALRQLEWLQYWDGVYDYAFGDEIETQIERVRELMEEAEEGSTP